MDDEKYGKVKSCNPYYCNICKVYCASAVNLQTHFLGLKHKAVEDALKAHGIIKPLNPSGESISLPEKESLPEYIVPAYEIALGQTLEEQLNSCKDTDPAIGLQYIIEYRSSEALIYECNLCISQGGLTSMFMHVLGIKHRTAYLKKHYPELAEVKGRGSKLNARLRELAAKVEAMEGRQPIKSTMDVPVPKDDEYSLQNSDCFVTWFTEDDKGKEKKNEDSKPAAKEASKDKGEDSSKSEDKKESEQSATQQQNALIVDAGSDSDEFTNNEGLLCYLRSFEIVDEDDAAFILKVTQKLTDALIMYREKISGRKKTIIGEHAEQPTFVGAYGSQAEGSFSEWELPAEQSFEAMGINASVKIPAEQSFEATGTNASVKRPAEQSFEATGTNASVKRPAEQSFEATGTNAKRQAKRKASKLRKELSKEMVKTRKPGGFGSSFKKVPDDPDSWVAKEPAEPQEPRAASRDARRLDSRQGLEAAARNRQGPKAASHNFRGQEPASSIPEGQDFPPSRRNRPRIPPFVPSQSEGGAIGKFFSSIRDMDVDEVAGTLQKISETNPAFKAPVVPRKAVWIIGHYIVYAAEDYASSSGWGNALGLEDHIRIKWIGRRGMEWDDLLPTVSLNVSRLGSPDALIIQLGDNDLPAKKEIDLTITVAADLHTLFCRLPHTRFFWSDMLKRCKWPGATSVQTVDLARKNVTSTAGQIVRATGGYVIQHPDITFKHTALYRSDGINLSEWGLDIWLHSVRHELLCWLKS
ncbi:uncharacterized protein LOC132577947 [Heteronotia binoei]|uniref:uncharacterized protein LOC132577947 n=1 Tax=Heteronotia binoei TaxID=13085 RepID=UPI00292FBBAC|nr:uncharacterized protein LOC132577947 [Heteronotia binoei]